MLALLVLFRQRAGCVEVCTRSTASPACSRARPCRPPAAAMTEWPSERSMAVTTSRTRASSSMRRILSPDAGVAVIVSPQFGNASSLERSKSFADNRPY